MALFYCCAVAGETVEAGTGVVAIGAGVITVSLGVTGIVGGTAPM